MKPKLSKLALACKEPTQRQKLEALIVIKGVSAWFAVDSDKLAKIRAGSIEPEDSAAEAWDMLPVDAGPLERANHLVLVVDGENDITPTALERYGDSVRPVFTPVQGRRIVELARAATQH